MGCSEGLNGYSCSSCEMTRRTSLLFLHLTFKSDSLSIAGSQSIMDDLRVRLYNQQTSGKTLSYGVWGLIRSIIKTSRIQGAKCHPDVTTTCFYFAVTMTTLDNNHINTFFTAKIRTTRGRKKTALLCNSETSNIMWSLLTLDSVSGG